MRVYKKIHFVDRRRASLEAIVQLSTSFCVEMQELFFPATPSVPFVVYVLKVRVFTMKVACESEAGCGSSANTSCLLPKPSPEVPLPSL